MYLAKKMLWRVLKIYLRLWFKCQNHEEGNCASHPALRNRRFSVRLWHRWNIHKSKLHRDWKLFLYYEGVISGAMLLIEEDERIEPNTLWKELIVSATVRADTYVISCLILSALYVSTGWAFTLCPTSRWPHNKSSILVWGALKRNLCFGDNVNGNPVDIWEIWICTCCAADAANDILVVVVVLRRLESLITGCGTCKTF